MGVKLGLTLRENSDI